VLYFKQFGGEGSRTPVSMTVIQGRPQMSCEGELASKRKGVDYSGRHRMLSLLLSQFPFMASA
jgi:hypothetical protein